MLSLLDARPFSDETVYERFLLREYRKGNELPLLDVVSPLFWRNNKKDVRHQVS